MNKESTYTNVSLLEAKNIYKSFQSGTSTIEVLRGITLTVQEGEIIIIMGPSGVGKSTLLNILGTLDRPTRGEIWFRGDNISNINEDHLARFRNRHIGFVFQFHHLLPEFTALENVIIPRMIKGRDWKSEENRARDLLNEVGLGSRLNHRPGQLSGGEQQRVAVARALMNSPQIIMADEPTGDLDMASSEALFDLLLSLNRKFNQTFIIVTHEPMFAKQADRVIHLWDGRIQSDSRSS